MSVELVEHTPDPEALVLYIARVSSNQENEDPGLLGYLIRNEHWSPFEHAYLTLEIVTSRAIAAQILRHRSFTFQEFSQRYSEAPGTVKYRARRQAKTNRQSSIDDLSEQKINYFNFLQELTERYCRDQYRFALSAGIAKEQARFLLPLATETKLYMTGSARSWIHYIKLRTDEHTQAEHRELALEAREIFTPLFPHTSKALGWLPEVDSEGGVCDGDRGSVRQAT